MFMFYTGATMTKVIDGLNLQVDYLNNKMGPAGGVVP